MMLALLFESAVRVLLLAVSAWLVMRAIRLGNPHVEKLAWRAVLLASLALPALLFWRLAPSLEIRLPSLITTIAGGTVTVDSRAGVTHGARFPIEITAIYFGIGALLLAGFLFGWARMLRLCRSAQPMPGRRGVRVTDRIDSPATFGSIILLPAAARGWSATVLDAVLAHERAHVRQRDCHWLWLAHLHAVIFWFSPFSWWLRRRLGALAESTSDDAVLASDHDPIAYAELLLEFSRQPNPGRVAMSASGSKVAVRIDRILSGKPPSVPPRRIASIVAAALLIPATVLVAASAASPATPADFAGLDDRFAPKIVDYGDLANLGDHYPPLAVQAQVGGMVTLGATLDADGRVVDVTVLNEVPADPPYGFGAAAMEVARTVRFEKPLRAPMLVKFKVKFTLDE